VNAGVAVVPETDDFVFQVKFTPFELYYFQVINRGMDQAFVYFTFERLVLLFEFRKMRLHRHAVCLLNQCPPMGLSLTQTHFKSDVTPGLAPQQTLSKAID
jgi:hypothetical protein